MSNEKRHVIYALCLSVPPPARRIAPIRLRSILIQRDLPPPPISLQATSNASSLKIVREAELYGGVLSSGLSREHLFLNAEFLRGDQ